MKDNAAARVNAPGPAQDNKLQAHCKCVCPSVSVCVRVRVCEHLRIAHARTRTTREKWEQEKLCAALKAVIGPDRERADTRERECERSFQELQTGANDSDWTLGKTRAQSQFPFRSLDLQHLYSLRMRHGLRQGCRRRCRTWLTAQLCRCQRLRLRQTHKGLRSGCYCCCSCCCCCCCCC